MHETRLQQEDERKKGRRNGSLFCYVRYYV